MSYVQQLLAVGFAMAAVILITSPRALRSTFYYRRKGSLSQVDEYFASDEGRRSVRSMRIGLGSFLVYYGLQQPPTHLPGTLLLAAAFGITFYLLSFFIPLRRAN
jgi:hypothetical protein